MSRARGQELDPFLRTRLCELHNTAQWSYGRIHKAYPHISVSTIKTTIRREKDRVNNRSRVRPGRPRKRKIAEPPSASTLGQISQQTDEVRAQQQSKDNLKTVLNQLDQPAQDMSLAARDQSVSTDFRSEDTQRSGISSVLEPERLDARTT